MRISTHAVILIALAAVISVDVGNAQSPSRAGWETAYSRRSYKLGIALSEFKLIKHPDDANAHAVCSNDAKAQELEYYEAKLYDKALEKAELVKCIHFTQLKLGSGLPLRATRAGLGLGDIGSITDFYFLKPDSQSDYILFWIRSGGPTSKFASLSESFKHAYGSPTTTKKDVWQNRAGTKLDNTVLVWRNATSEIEFKQIGSTIHIFELNLTLAPVMGIFEDRLKKQNAENAKRL